MYASSAIALASLGVRLCADAAEAPAISKTSDECHKRPIGPRAQYAHVISPMVRLTGSVEMYVDDYVPLRYYGASATKQKYNISCRIATYDREVA